MSLLHQSWIIFKKEMKLEWRQRIRFSGVVFFAFALLLMIAFASPSEGALAMQAGGSLWIGILLASTRALDQSYATELERDSLRGLLLWPVDGRAIYYGKAIANTTMLVMAAFILCPLIVGLYNAPIKGDLLQLAGFLIFGCSAISAPGTLYGLMTSQARGSSVLLPLLLFPLVVPALLASSRGTSLIFEGDPMAQGQSWLTLLIALNVLHWSLSGLFYSRLLEDS
jgi:heme exporter protein B